jgi:pimeloyl-ACP methyl ester carboxylesterase
MAKLKLDDVELYYELHGDGAPLLLIAGLASDSQSWQPVIGDLASRFHVITLDNRGSGRTIPQESATSIRAMADDCIALIGHLGLRSVNLLGHSMGGFVAQECAIRHPERVDKLVLVATSAANSKRNDALFRGWAATFEKPAVDLECWFRELFDWIFSERFLENAQTVAAAVDFALAYPYPQSARAFRNQVEAIAEFDSADRLGKIEAQALVLAAREDRLFPFDICSRFAMKIPRLEFIGIDGAAHSFHVETPAALTKPVLEFLSRR